MQTSTAADFMKFWLQGEEGSDSKDDADFENKDVDGDIQD